MPFDTETQMQAFREAMTPGAMGGIYTGYRPGGGGAEVSPEYSQQPIETGVGTATRFNLSGDTGISDVTNLINSLTRRAQSQALSARIPGAAVMEEQSSRNIGTELRGELPADVLRQIQQQAAEGGVGRGTSGAPANEAAYLRALGLTSLDLTGRGQQELSAAYARNPAAPIFDPASLLITPYQGAQLGLQAGQLALGQTEAAQRAAYEQAQLARSGGGGGGRGGGGYYGGGEAAPPAAPAYYGSYATGPDYSPSAAWSPSAPPGVQQAAWWNSIGYGMPQPTETGTGSMTINGQPIDLNTGQPLTTDTGSGLYGPGSDSMADIGY